jgi:hypothetical protein
LYGPGFRKGILSGESAVREVASFLLDGDFLGVPPTTYVEITKQNEKSPFNFSSPNFLLYYFKSFFVKRNRIDFSVKILKNKLN